MNILLLGLTFNNGPWKSNLSVFIEDPNINFFIIYVFFGGGGSGKQLYTSFIYITIQCNDYNVQITFLDIR